jgi:hypothetical protein
MVESEGDDIECIVTCRVVEGTPQSPDYVYFKTHSYGHSCPNYSKLNLSINRSRKVGFRRSVGTQLALTVRARRLEQAGHTDLNEVPVRRQPLAFAGRRKTAALVEPACTLVCLSEPKMN